MCPILVWVDWLQVMTLHVALVRHAGFDQHIFVEKYLKNSIALTMKIHIILTTKVTENAL